VVEKNIRIDEFFKDYDKLKKRTISMAQVNLNPVG
jgi:hypothetical protein